MRGAKPTVLLVDDDPVVISLYTAMFRESGFEVITAYDGGEGFECLKNACPDAILLDLTMPGMNGVEWLRAVRADERFRKVPVVILTATKKPEQMREALDSGVIVMHKHLADPDRVVDSVSRALRK